MAKFKTIIDGTAHEWNIHVDYCAVKALKEDGKDLFSMDAYLGGIFADVPSVIDAVCLLIGDQIEKSGVGLDAFLRSLRGDVLVDMQRALHEGIADFFPTARRRIMRLVAENAEKADAEIILSLESALTSGAQVTSSPEPSACPETPSVG